MFTPDAAFDVVPDWIALIDADCILRRVNRSMAEGLGMDEADMVGRHCHELLHGTDEPILRCPHRRLLRDSGEPAHDIVELTGRGLFEVSCAPLHDASGTLVGTVHMMHDVSRRVHVEMQAQETAHYLEQVLDAVPTPIYHKDAEGRYIAVNKAFAEAAGLERDQIVGRTAEDIYPAEFADDFRHHDEELLDREAGTPASPSGGSPSLGSRHVELHRSVYEDLAGEPTGIVGVEFDVTAREEAEAALLRAQVDLVRAQEIGLMGSWEWDIPRGQLHWSDELYRIWGVDRESFEPSFDGILDLVHPEDRATNQALLSRLDAGADSADSDFRIIQPGGDVRHLHETLEVERDADGAMIRAFGVMQDVTDRVRTREALSRREALLRGLFDTMPSGCAIYEVHGDGRSSSDYVIKDVNRTALAIEGRRREDMVGKSIGGLWETIDDSGLLEVLWRVWRTGDPERHTTRIVAQDGHTQVVRQPRLPAPTGDVVEIYSDVTAEKRAQESLRVSEAEMHAVFDLAGIPMAVLDTRGALRRWNRAFQKALGYPPEDLRRMTIRDITVPEERADMLRGLSGALEGEGTPYRQERQFVTIDGRATLVRRVGHSRAGPER